MAAARNRVSLRETGLIPVPQLPPPTSKLFESAHYGFAPDTQSRAAHRPQIRRYTVTPASLPQMAGWWVAIIIGG